MGKFEESLIDSLFTLCAAEPECARHMFVFPTSLMTANRAAPIEGARTICRGDVALVCRECA